MDSEQLDRDLAELFAGPKLNIDPGSDLNRQLFLRTIGTPNQQLPTGDEAVRNFPPSIELLPNNDHDRHDRSRAFAFAAIIVLFVFVGGLITAVVANRGDSDLATVSSNGSAAGLPWTPPPRESTSGLVAGPGTAQVVIVPPPLAGRSQLVESCFAPLSSWSPFEPGIGALLNVGYVEGTDDLQPVLFADTPGLFSSCSPLLGGGSTGDSVDPSALASVPFLFESATTYESEDGGSIEVELQGRIADNVAELEAIGVDLQVFRTDGRYFILNYQVPAGTADPGFIDSSGDNIRVRFDDGTEELRPLQTFPTPEVDCGLSEECVLEQAELAQAARATEQADVLGDGVLEQFEYAELVGQFSECLDSAPAYPFSPNVSVQVPAGSATADAVNACFEDRLRFVERARALQNSVWLGTPEGIDYQQAAFESLPAFPTDSHFGSVLYLTDYVSEEALTDLFNEISQLQVGAYRHIPAETTYRQFIDDFGADNLAPLTIDPSSFPDRIELISTSDTLWSSEVRQLQNLEQVDSVLEPVTLNPGEWKGLLVDGVQVGIASEDLLPEEFKPDGLDSLELGEIVTDDNAE